MFIGVLLCCITVEFILFKLLYPYASFFSDSYSYIFAAAMHLDVNVWPIGYSKFLQFFPWITRSHLALISFQFYFLEISALYFFLSILYFYRLQRITRRVRTSRSGTPTARRTNWWNCSRPTSPATTPCRCWPSAAKAAGCRAGRWRTARPTS